MRNRLYVLRNIRKYTSMVKGSVIGLIITGVLAVPISFISPAFFRILIDNVMYGGETHKFPMVVAGLLSVYVLRLISGTISLKLNNKVLNTFTLYIRKDVFRKYKKAPFSFIEKKESGELKMRIIDDVDKLGNFIKEQVADYISGILIIILSLCLSFSISVKMILCCLPIIPIVFLINFLIGKGTKRVNEEIRLVNGEYHTYTHNSLQFWREIKIQNAEKNFIDRFKEYRSIFAKLGISFIKYWAYREVFNDFKANYLTKVMVYIIGAFFVLSQEITLGTLMMFAEFFAVLFTALDSVNSKRVALKTNYPYYKRIFETLSFPEENNKNKKRFSFKHRIVVNNLSFEYIKGREVLSNIDLTVNKGEYIAIVGATGCGKTTLIKLLTGLYEQFTGYIKIDDTDIREIESESLYEKIGVVMQDNFLFNMSIKNNLLLSNENATEKEIIEACEKANIYNFIRSLPDGFDTQIGERGVRLSGGQKQRISIAAALLKKPEILIFDEATSSVDKLSEDIINESINAISKDITVIVITHKPSTALRAEKVVVIEDGQVAANGTHQELIQTNKYYQKLAEAAGNAQSK